ncbi:glycoside hydrolase family 43 protein [Paenibacillus sp. KQZ6P-2]|uniref:Glycoside hydrolase family 43 protein n=1 Tax=Paenibacillus mangrovi TaxID=2931978 RepID=A0A9X2B4B2_9BACL|nr:glycoside hydrolase family 43 protein [Paenibacillus mangrovi]MCJ8014444.1 glycoside hydrolase family 43 protein [Paenibacillus mangrovi]
MRYIQNPILKGFNPDPSILRVGSDYYIATSTFEWFPGVQIHHSRDMVNWKLTAHPLKRISQLDMKGTQSSGGVWAPCLSYDNGIFYLIYTNVKTDNGAYKDTHNYLVTTNDITGEWSEPVYLNSTGFDPSLFHDEDGRKWLVNMVFDHRKGKNRFGGILLQEYSVKEKRLVGPVRNIFKGTSIGFTEGAHLYKRNGYYYLLTAEGGTGLNHAVTMARSRSLTGPYEVDPQNPILTSQFNPRLELQKAGHGDLVETPEGEWYMVHLCGRPIPNSGRCTLGRETSIQKMVWTEDHWLRLEAGGSEPQVLVAAPELPEHVWESEPNRDDFDHDVLNLHFQTLRIPLGEETLSLKDRPGYLRLKGKESLSSKHHQALVARRQQSFKYTASVGLEFEPESYRQAAGLICLYDIQNYFYLYVSHDEEQGKCLGILHSDNNLLVNPLNQELSIEGWKRCFLQVRVDYNRLQFYYSKDEKEWTTIGPVMDASKLSDEYCSEGRYTGAFVGMCCQDLSGKNGYADFDYFEYTERD